MPSPHRVDMPATIIGESLLGTDVNDHDVQTEHDEPQAVLPDFSPPHTEEPLSLSKHSIHYYLVTITSTTVLCRRQA